MIDISILVPSVRVQNLPHVYKTIEENIGDYTFEMVVVSPFNIPDMPKNVKYLRDYGSPNRAMQLAGIISEGYLLMNCADDATFVSGGLKDVIDQYYDNENTKYNYMVAVQYTEDHRERMPGYWVTHTHDDLRLPTVPNVQFSAVHLCQRDFWRGLGGYDCQYDNPNFSTIEFMLRAMRDPFTKVELSNKVVYDVHWTQGASEEIRKPVHYSTLEHDIPLFKAQMSKPRPFEIDLQNWQSADRVWKRRFS